MVDDKPGQKRAELVTRPAAAAAAACPAVARPEELAGEAPARAKRRGDQAEQPPLRRRPQGEEDEAGIDEVGRRQKDVLEPPLAKGQPRRHGPARHTTPCPRGKTREGLGLGVDGEHAPAPGEHRQRVAALTAAEIDSATAGRHPRPRQRVHGPDQGRPWRPPFGRGIIALPVALVGLRHG